MDSPTMAGRPNNSGKILRCPRDKPVCSVSVRNDRPGFCNERRARSYRVAEFEIGVRLFRSCCQITGRVSSRCFRPGQLFKLCDDRFEKIALREIDRLSEPTDMALFLSCVNTRFWRRMGILARQNPVGQECPTYMSGFDNSPGA
jgi:hypothetical protein